MGDGVRYRYNLGHVKRALRRVQKGKQAAQEKEIRQSYQAYLDLAASLVERAEETLRQLASGLDESVEQKEIVRFVSHAHRQIDQIDRRVLQGESIPHQEKVFSLFEPHTQWISKGKAGVPVELGLNTCIMEDQYGYILHHRLMEGESDETVAVPIVEGTQARFSGLKQCSFDGGSIRRPTEMRSGCDWIYPFCLRKDDALPKRRHLNRPRAS